MKKEEGNQGVKSLFSPVSQASNGQIRTEMGRSVTATTMENAMGQ
jgi:hypothetical protein